MNRYIVTYEWTALAVIMMRGESAEEVEKKLKEVFPNVDIVSVKESADTNQN